MPLLYDKSQGKVVDVADNLVNDALATGNYRFRQGVRIPVVAPNGEEGTVLSDEMSDLIGKGFRYLTTEESKRRTQEKIQTIKEEAYGDRPVMAATLGALRGASLGLSDVALRLGGVDESALELQRRNEVASLVGEIGGGVASLLAPTGVAAAPLRALGAPSRAAAEAAMQLGRSAAIRSKAVDAAGVLTRGGRIQQAIVGGAAEGALIGAGQTISEFALQDPDLTAQKAMANVGLGAMFGGGLSGAGRVALEGADIGITKGLKALSETDAIPDSAAALAGRLSEMYGNAVKLSRAEFEIDEDAQKLWNRGNREFRKTVIENMTDPEALNRKITQNFDVVRDFTEQLSKDAGAAAKLQRELIDEDIGGGIANKVSKIEGNTLKDAERAAGVEIVDRARNKAITLADEMDAIKNTLKQANLEEGTIYQPGAIAQLSAITKDLRESAASGQGLGAISDSIIRAKNDLAENTALFAKNMEFLKETNPVQFATIKALRPVWAKLKEASVDPDIFGDLGSALAERADNLSTLIGATRDFDKNFFEYVKKGGSFERIPDYSKISNFLRNTEATSKEKKRRALDGFQSAVDEVVGKLKPVSDEKIVDGIKRLQKELSKSATKTDKETSQFITDKIARLEGYKARINEFNEQMAQTVAKAKQTKADFDKALDIAKEQRAAVLWLNSKESFTGKSLHGALLGGLGTGALIDQNSTEGKGLTFLGALGGAVIANPRAGLRFIYQLENAAQGLDKASQRSAAAFRRVNDKLAAQRNKTRAVVQGVRQATIREALRFDQPRTVEDDQKAFIKHKEHLDELGGDPAGLYERIYDAVGAESADESPVAVQKLFETSARGVAFLQSKIPSDPLANPLIPSDEYSPSFAELDKYARYVQAVKNPRTIFRELEAGDLQPETVEAVKAVYPKVYDSVVQSVATELMGEKEIPFDARVQLSILLGLPAVKALTPAYLATLAQITEGAQQQQQEPGSRMGTSQLVSFREMNASNRQQRED